MELCCTGQAIMARGTRQAPSVRQKSPAILQGTIAPDFLHAFYGVTHEAKGKQLAALSSPLLPRSEYISLDVHVCFKQSTVSIALFDVGLVSAPQVPPRLCIEHVFFSPRSKFSLPLSISDHDRILYVVQMNPQKCRRLFRGYWEIPAKTKPELPQPQMKLNEQNGDHVFCIVADHPKLKF